MIPNSSPQAPNSVSTGYLMGRLLNNRLRNTAGYQNSPKTPTPALNSQGSGASLFRGGVNGSLPRSATNAGQPTGPQSFSGGNRASGVGTVGARTGNPSAGSPVTPSKPWYNQPVRLPSSASAANAIARNAGLAVPILSGAISLPGNLNRGFAEGARSPGFLPPGAAGAIGALERGLGGFVPSKAIADAIGDLAGGAFSLTGWGNGLLGQTPKPDGAAARSAVTPGPGGTPPGTGSRAVEYRFDYTATGSQNTLTGTGQAVGPIGNPQVIVTGGAGGFTEYLIRVPTGASEPATYFNIGTLVSTTTPTVSLSNINATDGSPDPLGDPNLDPNTLINPNATGAASLPATSPARTTPATAPQAPPIPGVPTQPRTPDQNSPAVNAALAAAAGLAGLAGLAALANRASSGVTSAPASTARPNNNPPAQNPQTRTKPGTTCGCNAPVISSVNNFGGSLGKKIDEINDKLGNAGLAAGQGLSLASILQKLNQMQAFAEKAWESTRLQKLVNMLTLITVIHNAGMLSREIIETLGYVLSNGLSAVGIKDENDQPLDINDLVGNSIESFFRTVLGNDVYEDVRDGWKRANRIYQAGANIVFTLRNIADGTGEILEWTAENVGKIGNALKKYGVVGQRAYPFMSERVKAQDLYRRKFARVYQGLENLDDTANSLATVSSEVVEIQEEFNQLKDAKDRFRNEVADLGNDVLPTISPENVPIKANADTENANSQSPDVGTPDIDPNSAT